MSIRFLRPVGAVADFNELEYIAALHQSCKEVDENFEDGSIDADDVKYFLLSRFGISVTPETVCKEIFSGIAGGSDEDACLDLAEVLSLLIIPLLLSVAKKNESEKGGIAALGREDFVSKWQYDKYLHDLEVSAGMVPPETVIDDMLSIILKKTLGYEVTEPPKLTKDLVKSMFAAYNETELVEDDELIDKMIAAATEDGEKEVTLDAKTFARALTSDIQKYNISNDFSLSTIRDDVFGAGVTDVVEEKYTAPQIDFLAERFVSQLNAALSLLAFMLSYLMHIFFSGESATSLVDLDGCNGGDEVGCSIAQSIVDWLIIMVTLVAIGVPYVFILNLGNRTSPSFAVNLVELLFGIVGVVLLLIVPGFVSFNAAPIFSVTAAADGGILFIKFPLYWMLAIGFIILIIKLVSLFQLLFSDTVSKYPLLSALLTPNNVKKELYVKQAATYKVNRMVKNALELHSGKVDNEHVRINLKLYESEPMLNFNAINKELEPTGGMSWAWKNYVKGDLFTQEGIWINARIKSGVFFQLVYAIAMITLGVVCYRFVVDFFYPLSQSNICVADADPDSCQLVTLPYFNATFSYYFCTKVSFSSPECVVDTFYNPADSFGCEFAQDQAPDLIDSCPYFGSMRDEDYGQVYALVSGSREKEDICALSVDYCAFKDYKENDSSSVQNAQGVCIMGFTGRGGKGCEDSTLVGTELIDVALPLFSDQLGLWKVKLSVVIATIVGFSWSFFLGVTYIASAVSTILRYRSGVLQSLRGRADFNKNRASTSTVSLILGAMFWGDFFSSICLLVLVLLLLIILLLPFVRPYLLNAVALVAGIAFSIGLKMVLVIILGKRNTKGFYTSNPIITHVFGIALECWSIALTSLSMLVRTIKIIVAAVLFIGRIDIPFLADGADKLGPVVLDPYSSYFRQELLSADAHHHPYIERLGCMYLMMLKHGEEFCDMPGSTWRLLFIFALMPWVQLSRITDDEENPEDEDDVAKPKKPTSLTLSSDNGKETLESAMAKNSDLMKEIEILKAKILSMKENKV